MSEKISLLDLLRNYELHPPVIERDSSDSNYPSSLSIKIINSYGESEIMGGCQRHNFYRRRGDSKTDFGELNNNLIMKAGKAVEEFIVMDFRSMGIFCGSNIKFYDKIYNIAGEIDIFVKPRDKKLVLVELKTGYGKYFDKDVLGYDEWGKRLGTGYPKIEHLIQTAPYLEKYKEITDELHLIYFNRGSFLHPAEFILTLKEGKVCVDGVESIVNLENIRTRILDLEDFIERSKIPPKDYQWKYTEEFAQKLVDTKRKSTYWFNNSWKKDKNITGDWHCRYCEYRSKCYGDLVKC